MALQTQAPVPARWRIVFAAFLVLVFCAAGLALMRKDATPSPRDDAGDGLDARIRLQTAAVAFSSGNIYPLVDLSTGGSRECDPVGPIGEYPMSVLARERVFEYAASEYGTRVLLFRLSYAIDLRYGVLNDIGRAIWEGRPVSNTVGYYNVIWQGDVTANALRSLELASPSCEILNVTGPETGSVEETALIMGKLMGKEVRFQVEKPGELNYLNNAGKMFRLFGYPRISLDELIRLQADWIAGGGITIGKPTHFEVNNGKF